MGVHVAWSEYLTGDTCEVLNDVKKLANRYWQLYGVLLRHPPCRALENGSFAPTTHLREQPPRQWVHREWFWSGDSGGPGESGPTGEAGMRTTHDLRRGLRGLPPPPREDALAFLTMQ